MLFNCLSEGRKRREGRGGGEKAKQVKGEKVRDEKIRDESAGVVGERRGRALIELNYGLRLEK